MCDLDGSYIDKQNKMYKNAQLVSCRELKLNYLKLISSYNKI